MIEDFLKIHYGFDNLRPGQLAAINAVLAGKSALVIMPTGGGKSLCYQLPALVLDGVTLVVSPLIALMKDQVDGLNKRGIPAAFINSSLSMIEVGNRLAEVKRGDYKLLYIAPERFYSKDFLDVLKEVKIGLFAVDEAHCISQWGHDFRPSYARLAQALTFLGNPPVIALTATATPQVKQDIIKQLKLVNPELVVTGFARKNLSFHVLQANENEKIKILLNFVKKFKAGSGIIYAGTRNKVEDILSALRDSGISAVGYHAGMEAVERDNIQGIFMNSQVKIIVATNAFGMGIDKQDIRFIIHANMPRTLEAYYQEVGRAGRDGAPSQCLLLYSNGDRFLQEFFIEGDNPSFDLIYNLYQVLIEYNQDNILVTYADLKANLGNVPEMAIGTALKILEKEGYLMRQKEKTGEAFLQLLVDEDELLNSISPRAKAKKAAIDAVLKNFNAEIKAGWHLNFDEVAGMLDLKKDSLIRFIRELAKENLINYTPPFKGTEINILKRVDEEDFKINKNALQIKRDQAYGQLDKMEDFIHGVDCRQKYILDYFGEENPADCGQCDNCVVSPVSAVTSEKLSTKLTQLSTFELYVQGMSVGQIAEARGLSPNTVTDHICYLIEKNLIQDIEKIIDSGKINEIAKAIKHVQSEKLTPVKEALGDDYSWEEIKIVKAYLACGKAKK